MKWPWVSRALYERARFDLETNMQGVSMLSNEAKSLHRDVAQLATEREYLAGELANQKGKVALLHGLCNELQAKQHDLDEPPISSTDLRDTLRRLSLLQTENAALKAVVEELESNVNRWRDRAQHNSPQGEANGVA